MSETLKELLRLVIFGAVSGIYLALRGEVEANELLVGTGILKIVDNYLHRALKQYGYPKGIKGLSVI